MNKRVIVDAFGGDHSPLEIIKGVKIALENSKFDVILCGNSREIEKVASENFIDISGIEIINCDSVLSNDDDPLEITRSKKNSSMALGLYALADNRGDAFVSAGNSGALLVGTSLIVKRSKGVKRIAFTPFVPKHKGKFLLLDGGANTQCTPEMLLQFAFMGSNYIKNISKIKSPKISLLNIGMEKEKGDELRKETFKLLKNSNLNFIGNIEANQVLKSESDVVVTDGFSGNIFIKTFEGVAENLVDRFKSIFDNLLSKSKIFESQFDVVKKLVSYSRQGGALLLGASKPVIKAHGTSKAEAIKNAISLAARSIVNKA